MSGVIAPIAKRVLPLQDGPSDLELLRLFKAGHDSAFDTIVRKHQDRIYRFLAQMVGNPEDAADLAQETFVKAYSAIGRFRGGSSLYTWLYRIAYNVSLNFFRKNRLRNLFTENNHTVEVPQEIVVGEVNTPETDLLRKQQLEQVELAIRHLPPRQRSIFVMRHYEDLSHAEIAEVLDRSEGAVRSGYFHAVRKLRETLVDCATKRNVEP